MSDGAVACPDGHLRCPWGLSAPEYLAYHDEEWGRPLHGDQPIFERLCLEAFQSGLSWLTVLRKRENFRAAFAGFDIESVAGLTVTTTCSACSRTSASSGTGRRSRPRSRNARAALAVPGGLSELVWKYAGEPARRRGRWRTSPRRRPP